MIENRTIVFHLIARTLSSAFYYRSGPSFVARCPTKPTEVSAAASGTLWGRCR